MIATELDGFEDDDEILGLKEDKDGVCEAVALVELDEPRELVGLPDDSEEVKKAPVVWDELDLVLVIKVLFTLVVKIAGLEVLALENVVLGTTTGKLATGHFVRPRRNSLPEAVELPLFELGNDCPFVV